MAEEGTGNLFARVVTIVALAVIGAVVIWGLVSLASLSSGWFASLFSRGRGGGEIAVTAPPSAISGEPLTVSWKYTPRAEGRYGFIYPCVQGLRFDISADGARPIRCGAALIIASTSRSIVVTPILTGTTTTSVPVTISYFEGRPGATTTPRVTAQGSATVAILVSTSTPRERTPAGTGAPQPPPRKTGPADLAVRIVAVGVIDPATDRFVPGVPVPPGGMAAVQFDIGNVGGSSTGPWGFSAQLPTRGGYAYESPMQAPLNPGDHVLNTLRFTQVNPGGGAFSVTARAANDANPGDNSARATVIAQ